MSPKSIELLERGRLVMEAAEAASCESASLLRKMQDAMDALAWTARDLIERRPPIGERTES